MNKKLYVGNLSFETTQDELQALFAEIGTVVSAAVVTDKSSNRSRGFGFVEMETEETAKEAIDKLNGREVNQRSLTVNEAHPPENVRLVEATGEVVGAEGMIAAVSPI